MAQLRLGDRSFAAEMVIFDKDGTLIDFADLWAHYLTNAVESLLATIEQSVTAQSVTAQSITAQGVAALRGDLYTTFGYDPVTRLFDPQSPAVTAPLPVLSTLAAGVLYRHGWGWLPAEMEVQRSFGVAISAPPPRELIKSTADLPALFGALRAANVQIAVVTSDDRTPTLTALTWLGIIDHIAFIAAADDGYAHKPAPDAVWAACEATHVPVTHTIMVGDSTTDMLMAQRAGVGLRVAVLTGTMDTATLAPLADVVLPSVGAIQVDEPE